MSLFFGLGQSFSPYRAGFPESDHHHVHIVIMSVSCISRQIKIFPDDIFYRFPSGLDITANPPGTGHFFRPGTRISPTANVKGDLPVYDIDMLTDIGIPVSFVQPQITAPAIIDFNKIKTPVPEIQLGILCFVPVNSGPDPRFILIRHRTTGIIPGICINTGLQPQIVDMIHDDFHTVRKPLCMFMHLSGFIPITEKSVIDIYKPVSCIF